MRKDLSLEIMKWLNSLRTGAILGYLTFLIMSTCIGVSEGSFNITAFTFTRAVSFYSLILNILGLQGPAVFDSYIHVSNNRHLLNLLHIGNIIVNLANCPDY